MDVACGSYGGAKFECVFCKNIEISRCGGGFQGADKFSAKLEKKFFFFGKTCVKVILSVDIVCICVLKMFPVV